MKNVLLYYSFSFSFGGGDHLPLSFIAALQDTCRLTVALDLAPNLERAARTCGIDVDLSKIEVVQVTPPNYDPKRHTPFVSLYRSRRLKALAKRADVCISAANIFDFGRPAHHFINMLAYGDDAFTAYALNGGNPPREGIGRRLKRLVAECALRPILGMRSKRSIIRDGRERIYPNSRFVEKLMTDFYGPFNSSVFYPPTLFEPTCADVVRDPLKVVYIGRVIPEKRIDDMIGVVEKARAATGLDVRFHVAGRLDQTPAYGAKLRAMAAERSWLRFEGALYGEEKERFLLSGSYALHAERIEAFGISVAEYLKAGCVAIVPDEGGSCEVVGSPELAYRSYGDAAAILSKLLTDEEFRNAQAAHCAARAAHFSREAYLARQREALGGIIGA